MIVLQFLIRIFLARNLRGFKNLEDFVSEWKIKERIEIMRQAYWRDVL